MKEKRPNPTSPDDIKIPKTLEFLSRKKGVRYRQGHTKRIAIDFIMGGTMRAATYPVEVGLRIVVRIKEGKPTIYSADRLGSDGTIFIAPKIRTMRNGSDNAGSRYEQGNGFHDEKDPRVNRVGTFLRRHDVDELPQLRLVRKGKMSLVDIRPHTPKDEEMLELVLGKEEGEKRTRARSEGKPGLFNLPTTFDREKMREGDETMGNKWDIWFAENDSFGLDIYVVGKTILMKTRNFYNRVVPHKKRVNKFYF